MELEQVKQESSFWKTVEVERKAENKNKNKVEHIVDAGRVTNVHEEGHSEVCEIVQCVAL